MATRRKIVTAKIAEDNSTVSFDIHGPADDAGKFPVVDTLDFAATSLPEGREVWFALYGLSQIVSNRYNRMDDDATPGDVRLAVLEVLDAVRDGSWTPGRSFVERDPTDLEMAIAEATGQPVADVMDRVENTFELAADGTPKLDKKGRRARVFNKRMLDSLAQDAKIKPILARLVAERAKRLSAEAKRGGGTDLLGSMFTNAPAVESEQSTQNAEAAD